MFFRSILPNFNPADPLPEAAEGAAGGAGEGGQDLRNSVNSLLDAMRDLLGNLQLPEVRTKILAWSCRRRAVDTIFLFQIPNEGDDEADDGEERDPREWD